VSDSSPIELHSLINKAPNSRHLLWFPGSYTLLNFLSLDFSLPIDYSHVLWFLLHLLFCLFYFQITVDFLCFYACILNLIHFDHWQTWSLQLHILLLASLIFFLFCRLISTTINTLQGLPSYHVLLCSPGEPVPQRCLADLAIIIHVLSTPSHFVLITPLTVKLAMSYYLAKSIVQL
jgi:hypothetical protein